MMFLITISLKDVYIQGNEKTIYEFVVRHFLACCSRDAQGQETTVEIDIHDERVDYFYA
jgi:DNA topoisomerase IA